MNVAVAVITDVKKKRVLLTRRAKEGTFGGLWEFPGGKLKAGETPVCALIREIKEEVGLTVKKHHFLGKIPHNYPEYSVTLWVYLVASFSGEPTCQESQSGMCWADIAALDQFEFPEANKKIINSPYALPLAR